MTETMQAQTSIGAYGLLPRTYDRVGNVVQQRISDDSEVLTEWQRTVEFGRDLREQGLMNVSRYMLRGEVSNSVLDSLLVGNLRREMDAVVEVAVDQSEFGREGWLIDVARNEPWRTPAPSTQSETYRYRAPRFTPAERIRAVVSRPDHRIITTISDQHIEQLHELWGHSFDWERDEVEAFAKDVAKQQDTDPADRSIWFAAVVVSGKLASAAYGERLGQTTELTEWCTGQEYQGRGYMAATVAATVGQRVHSFLQQSPSDTGKTKLPYVYAEDNEADNAIPVALAVHMRPPEPIYALGELVVAQRRIQNVKVGDRVGKGIRNFSTNYLPASVYRDGGPYSPQAAEEIVDLLEAA